MPVLLILSLLWLLIGFLLGLLANAARWQTRTGRRHSWLVLPGIGALAAFCAGWLGVLVLGKFFATFVAVWCAVLFTALAAIIMRRIYLLKS